MGQTENITAAVMKVLEEMMKRPASGWVAVEKRVAAAVEEQLRPSIALAESIEQTEKTLGDRRLYTTHEIARLLQVHVSAVTKWINAGKLTAFRTPGGHRRVRAQDLKAFCEKHEIPITGELAET